MIRTELTDVIIGVETHKDVHAAFAIRGSTLKPSNFL
jgi:hypothetical protein